LQHPDARIVRGACKALVLYCGTEGAVRVNTLLEGMVHSQEIRERIFAAEAAGYIGTSVMAHVLMPLLTDEDMSVRNGAIESARYVDDPEVYAAVLENISYPQLRSMVIKTLIHKGKASFPALEMLYHQDNQSSSMKKTIVRIYGRNRGDEAISMLKKKLDEPDRDIQEEILASLRFCNYEARGEDYLLVNGLLRGAGSYATRLMCAMGDIDGHKGDALIYRALRDELDKTKKRIFSLLSFIYPSDSVQNARSSYFYATSDENRAVSVELLDTILSKEHKGFLLPVLEDTSFLHRRDKLRKFFPQETKGRPDRLKEIIYDHSLWQGRWLKATALHSVARSLEMSRTISIDLNDERVREARDWTVSPDDFSGAWPDKSLSTVEKVKVLKRAGIFSEISDEVLSEIAPFVEEENHSSHVSIIRKGEMASTLYIIAQGRVLIHQGPIIVTELNEGEIFGELSALIPEARTADVDTLEETKLLAVTDRSIYGMIDGRIEVARGIIGVLCRRIESTIEKGIFGREGAGSSLSVGVAGLSRDFGLSKEPDRARLEDFEKMVILKTVEIFSAIPENVLMDLAAFAEEERLDAGEILFQKGSMGTSMFIVVHGLVKVHDRDHVIATLCSGEIIGEMAALSSHKRSASITALEDTRLLKITQEALYELMWDFRGVAKGLIHILVKRLRKMMA
jgi:CRP/FNR family cyclic AMP-dependent transcriptional regulator